MEVSNQQSNYIKEQRGSASGALSQPKGRISRAAAQENFGAYSARELQDDTLKITKKAEKAVKENWMFSILRNTFGVENPKKFVTSIGLMIASVAGIAVLGNTSINKMALLGNSVDKKIAGNGLYKKTSGFLSSAAGSVKGFILKHSKSARDIAETFKNRHAKGKWGWGRSITRGPAHILDLTPPDIASKAVKQGALADKTSSFLQFRELCIAQAKTRKALNGLVQGTPQYSAAKKAADAAQEAVSNAVTKAGFSNKTQMMQSLRDAAFEPFKKIMGSDKAAMSKTAWSALGIKPIENDEFLKLVTDGIVKTFNCGNDKRKLIDILMQGKTGKINGVDVSDFINVYMSDGKFSPMSNWWPVNFLNKAYKALTGKETNFGKGNLFDALLKANVVEGRLADTFIGRLVQKSILIPSECISNFVNDKSGWGAILCFMSLKPMFDTLQDAPKEKRTAMAANDLANSVGHWTIITPLAAGLTYGLATLANLKGTTLLTKILKQPGKIFNIGLDKYAKDGSKVMPKKGLIYKWTKGGTNGLPGIAGAVMRFALIGFIFSGLFSRPMSKIVKTIFGDPDAPVKKPAQNRSGQSVRAQRPVNASSYYKQQTPALRAASVQKQPQTARQINSQAMTQTNTQTNPFARAVQNNMQPVNNNPVKTNLILQHAKRQQAQMKEQARRSQGHAPAAAAGLNAPGIKPSRQAQEEQLYVPSIQVDNSYAANEEKALNERVQRILKSSDETIKNITSKYRR